MKSVFGMHQFDTTDPRVVASQKKFWITIAVLAVATYATAFAAYWLFRSRKEEFRTQDRKERRPEGKRQEVWRGESRFWKLVGK
jgi:hypothetical protein